MSNVEQAQAPYHAVIGADEHTTITYWSEGAARLFGHTEADALGRELDLIVPERLRAAHREGYRLAMAAPAVQDTVLDLPVLLADGREQELPVRLLVLSDPFGVALGALAVFTSDGRTGIGL